MHYSLGKTSSHHLPFELWVQVEKPVIDGLENGRNLLKLLASLQFYNRFVQLLIVK